MISSRIKDGVRNQVMTTVVKIVGSVVPVRADIAALVVRGIFDMVPETGGAINLREAAFPATMMCSVILHRVPEKPVTIRTLHSRTKDGVRNQDMTIVVKIAGYNAPKKVDIAVLMVRGIFDMVPETDGTIDLR